MKKVIFIKISLLLILSSSILGAQTRMTLKDCIEKAWAQNRQVQQTGLSIESAQINHDQAKANRLPNLNGSFGYGLNQGRTVDPLTNAYINQQLLSSNLNLSTGIIIYNGLRLQNLIKQTGMTYEAAKMDFQQAKDNLALNVLLAYLQVLSSEDVLSVARIQLALTIRQVERVAVLVNQGSNAPYLLSDLKGQQSAEEINILNLENALQQAKLALCQLMNSAFIPDLQLERGDIDTPPITYESGANAVYEKASQNLALVKANDWRIKSADMGIQVARSGFYPILSLTGNLGSTYSSLAERDIPTDKQEVATANYVVIGGNRNPVLTQKQNYLSESIGFAQQLADNLGLFVGVNLQVPIFNNFQVKNRLKLAEIAAKNARLESENVKIQLRQNIEQAYLNHQTSFNRYRVLTEQVGHLTESLRAAETRFANGAIHANEFLLTKTNLDRAKLSLAQTRYEVLFRTKLLDFYQGKQIWSQNRQ
jgi:outer membrane protein